MDPESVETEERMVRWPRAVLTGASPRRCEVGTAGRSSPKGLPRRPMTKATATTEGDILQFVSLSLWDFVLVMS